MKDRAKAVAARALALLFVAGVIVLPLAASSRAATPTSGGLTTTSASTIGPVTSDDAYSTSTVPTITLTDDPWPTYQGKPMFDGFSGMSFSDPGYTVSIRDESSVAFFVDEIWLVYPKVEYLFNNKDVLPYCGGVDSNMNVVTELRAEHGIVFMPGRPGYVASAADFDASGHPTAQALTDAANAGLCRPLPAGAPLLAAGSPNFLGFSAPISLGSFPQGTELVFATRTGAGIDDACQDRIRKYQWIGGTATPPQGLQNPLPSAPSGDLISLQARDYYNTDPVYVTDLVQDYVSGNTLGNPALWSIDTANTVTDVHHCYVGTHAANAPASIIPTAASMTPIAPDPGAGCAPLSTAANPLTQASTSCWSTAWPMTTPDGRSLFYTGPGSRNVAMNFPQARLQYLQGQTAASGLTGLFGFEDAGLCDYVGGTYQVAGCANQSDYADVGLAVTSLLAATCSPTTTANVITISGQPGYPSVQLGSGWSTSTSTFATSLGYFAPGSTLTFVSAPTGTAPTVSPSNAGSTSTAPGSGAFTVTTGQQVQATVYDPNAPATIVYDPVTGQPLNGGQAVANPDAQLPGGICYDPSWPPIVTKPAQVTTFACSATATAWDFTITNAVDPAAQPTTAGVPIQGQAPAAIDVTWTNGGNVTVPLSSFTPTNTSVTPNVGTAHYTTTLHTDTSATATDPWSAVTGATMAMTGTWSGTFQLAAGPCDPTQKPLTLTPPLPSCTAGATAWDFAVSQITSGISAPSSVSVTWADATSSTETVPLEAGTPAADGVAHYTTSSHTGAAYAPYSSVSATVSFTTVAAASAFTGTLTAASVPCPPPSPTPTPTPIPSVSPSATPTPVPVGGCEQIYNPSGAHVPNAGDNPLSGENPDGFYRLVGISGDHVRIKDTDSSYMTPEWPSGTTIKLTQAVGRTPTYWSGPGATDYEVRLTGDAEMWVYDDHDHVVNKVICYVPRPPKGSVSPAPSGSPCPLSSGDGWSGATASSEDDNGDCSGASPSPTIEPSETPSPTQTAPPTQSTPPGGTTIHVKTSTLTGYSCDPSQWHFVITQIGSAAPSSISVTWANGDRASVALSVVTGGTAQYSTTQDLSTPVTDATAVVPPSWGGQFNISSGPCGTTSAATPSPSPSSPSSTGGASPSPSSEGDQPGLRIVGRSGSTLTLDLCFPQPIGCRLIEVPVTPSSD